MEQHRSGMDCNILSLMLYAYAFMVSGLFVPVVAAMLCKKVYPQPALAAMIAGGTTTICLIMSQFKLPFALDANIFGLSVASIVYFSIHFIINYRGIKIMAIDKAD